MTKLHLLGAAWTRSFRCIWMLEELGVPYRHVPVMPASRSARKYNPSGKVPVLLEFNSDHDDENEEPALILYESTAINTYLAEVYGKDTHLVPTAGTRPRALYDQTIACLLSELDAQALWIHRKHEALGRVFGHVPAAVEAAAQQFARIHPQIAAQLDPYVLGPHFTAADIMYVHCLTWAEAIGWQGEGWSDQVQTYLDRCRQRPAYQRAQHIRQQEKEAEERKKASPPASEASDHDNKDANKNSKI